MIMHAGEILRRRGLLTAEQLTQSMSDDNGSVIQSAINLGRLRFPLRVEQMPALLEMRKLLADTE